MKEKLEEYNSASEEIKILILQKYEQKQEQIEELNVK